MKLTATIVQRRLTNYRVPLFERMREQLAEHGVRLRVLHGDAQAAELSKNDGGTLPWAEHLPTRYMLSGRLCWQPFMQLARGSDLIVLTQENKLVNNLPLLLAGRRPERIAFWGHGRNMQSRTEHSLRESFKRWTSGRVDWWFAYTALSAGLVQAAGYPPQRITVLDNSIDTDALVTQVAHARRSVTTAALRAGLGLDDAPTGVFIGSLYSEKRLPFLIAAADALYLRVPGFQLAIAGAGPDEALARAAAARNPRIRFLGQVQGERKAALLACADVMLNPGLVGLGILDAFAAGLPLVTTDCGLHSPEVCYLQDGVNGFMTPDTLDDFVAACEALLSGTALCKRVSHHAAQSAGRYSLQNMAERFSAGIVACLAQPPR